MRNEKRRDKHGLAVVSWAEFTDAAQRWFETEASQVLMLHYIKLVATLCSGVFFGAALYISLVQHPAALELGSDFAARFFPPMYGRAAVMQSSLAVVGCAAGIAAWLRGAGLWWLASAALLGSVVPFTLIVMKSVNDALLEGDNGSDVELPELLLRWGYLHWARTVASGLAFVTSLVAMVRRAA